MAKQKSTIKKTTPKKEQQIQPSSWFVVRFKDHIFSFVEADGFYIDTDCAAMFWKGSKDNKVGAYYSWMEIKKMDEHDVLKITDPSEEDNRLAKMRSAYSPVM